MQSISNKGEKVTYRIENLVTSVDIGLQIPLETVADFYRDADFNLNKFPGICLRLRKPKCAILLFKNGKMIITGLKKSEHVLPVLNKVIVKLDKIGITTDEFPEVKTVNIVISIDIKKKLNLDLANLKLDSSIYEPEVFPGLIFRIYEPKAVFLLFSSGKVVLTGLKEESQIEPTIKILGSELRKHDLI